jgi:hypothetical protein
MPTQIAIRASGRSRALMLRHLLAGHNLFTNILNKMKTEEEKREADLMFPT